MDDDANIPIGLLALTYGLVPIKHRLILASQCRPGTVAPGSL